MIKYIRADLYRIFRRKARIIIALLFIYLTVDQFWPGKQADTTIVDAVDVIESVLKYAPPILGFLEMFYVFADDFAGKTAQIAIGTGIKRIQVIMTKWVDMLILISLDLMVLTGLSAGLAQLQAGSMPAGLSSSLVAHVVVAIISTMAYVSIVMPIMFAMQSVTLSNILYLVLSFGLIFKLLGFVSQLERLQKFNIGSITLTNALNVLRSRMLLGSFHIVRVSFIAIVIYTAAGIAVTYLIYRNRELEF